MPQTKRVKKNTGKRKSSSRNPLKDSDAGSSGRADLPPPGSTSGPARKPTDDTEPAGADMSLGDLSDDEPAPSKRKRDSDLSDAAPQIGRTTSEPDLSSPAGSILTPREHPGLPAGATVAMKPRIRLDKDGTITKLSFSGRTPSPFGSGRMGDHTVAWSALVDAVRAKLHGLPVRDAIGVLRAEQEHVQAWMADPDSTGMKLFDKLDDRAARVERLEHWAWQTTSLLDTATAATSDAAAATGLQQAVAHHLAYLNFLPYATVQSLSEGGSRGSAEGTKRGRILDAERAGPLGEAKVGDLAKEPGEELRDQLWGLFAFDAAFRAADVDVALAPGDRATVEPDHLTVKKLLKELYDTMEGPASDVDKQRVALRIATAANKIRVSSPEPAVVQEAGMLKDEANLHATEPSRSVSPNQQVVLARRKLEQAVERAAVEVEHTAAWVSGAPAHAARVLATLLHEHQTTMATAYPRAVTVSGFLGNPADARAAAVERLTTELNGAFPPPRPAKKSRTEAPPEPSPALVKLLADVSREYNAIGTTPAPAKRNDWAGAATNEPLVVTYDPVGAVPLTVNGRALAPVGVAGMGSHTTAWTVEVDAVRAIVAKAGGEPAKALKALREETVRDLQSDVMTLDQLLPAEQLQGGQVLSIFTQAKAVLDATDIVEGVRSFLSFRNLLPFATVDAGDRGGHGERSGGPTLKNYDEQSLTDATDLQVDALQDPDRQEEAVQALDDAAKALDEIDFGDVLNPIAEATSDRLRDQADALEKGDSAIPVRQILKIRWAEHTRVSAQAG